MVIILLVGQKLPAGCVSIVIMPKQLYATDAARHLHLQGIALKNLQMSMKAMPLSWRERRKRLNLTAHFVSQCTFADQNVVLMATGFLHTIQNNAPQMEEMLTTRVKVTIKEVATTAANRDKSAVPTIIMVITHSQTTDNNSNNSRIAAIDSKTATINVIPERVIQAGSRKDIDSKRAVGVLIIPITNSDRGTNDKIWVAEGVGQIIINIARAHPPAQVTNGDIPVIAISTEAPMRPQVPKGRCYPLSGYSPVILSNYYCAIVIRTLYLCFFL